MVGRSNIRALTLVGALGAALFSSACAHVGRDEFQAEMDLLRQDMANGDRAVAEDLDGVDSRVEALESQMSMLEDELQGLADEYRLSVERLESSLRVHVPVEFGFDEDRLNPSQLPVLDRVAGVLTEYYPQAILTVEGMTDPSGSAEYNMALGLRRAESVRGFLIQQGWSESRVRAVSYGESSERLVEVGAGGPDAGRTNRRAVVVIDHPEGPAARAIVAETGGN